MDSDEGYVDAERSRRRIKLTSLVKEPLPPSLAALRDRAPTLLRSWEQHAASTAALMVVPAGDWTKAGPDNSRYPLVGTAFDYLAGAVYARNSLDEVLVRAERACVSVARPALRIFPLLARLIAIGPLNLTRGGARRRHDDFYRGLMLLAQMDDVYRGRRRIPPVHAPSWTVENPPTDLPALRRALRKHYPLSLVEELHDLQKCLEGDLPPADDVIYNPIFGAQIGDFAVAADGDLLVGDLLWELKVSVQQVPSFKHVLQLLGYAALRAASHGRPIRQVGIYNPRWRFRWVEDVDRVAAVLGLTSFAQFCGMFEASVTGLPTRP